MIIWRFIAETMKWSSIFFIAALICVAMETIFTWHFTASSFDFLIYSSDGYPALWILIIGTAVFLAVFNIWHQQCLVTQYKDADE